MKDKTLLEMKKGWEVYFGKSLHMYTDCGRDC